MELLRESYKTYEYIIYELSDPRANRLPLIETPLYIILIGITYSYFVQNLGPMLMEKRKPFDLKNFMILYNTVQILCSGYLTYKLCVLVYIPMRHNLMCEPIDYSDDPVAVEVLHLIYLYFLYKIIDLLDTIFMVLRKKHKQISFLHVYHHTGMIFGTWIAVKYAAGSHTVFAATINSLVHTVMYFYYLLTAVKPKYKESVGWKRYLTELQLVQFIIVAIHGLSTLVINCEVPRGLLMFFIPQELFIFALFWDFYRKTYLKKGSIKTNDKVKES